jgi:hypothetical protein
MPSSGIIFQNLNILKSDHNYAKYQTEETGHDTKW